MEIRKIHPGEVDDLISIIHQYAEEAAEQMPEIAGEISDNIIVENIRAWSIQHTHNLLVAFDNTRPVGFVAGFITQMPWGSTFQASIQFLYLTESHRNMDNFRSLLEAFEDWARSRKATKVFAGDIGIDVERSRKVYGYVGYTEGLFVTKGLTNA